jgi:hypothetical protein
MAQNVRYETPVAHPRKTPADTLFFIRDKWITLSGGVIGQTKHLQINEPRSPPSSTQHRRICFYRAASLISSTLIATLYALSSTLAIHSNSAGIINISLQQSCASMIGDHGVGIQQLYRCALEDSQESPSLPRPMLGRVGIVSGGIQSRQNDAKARGLEEVIRRDPKQDREHQEPSSSIGSRATLFDRIGKAAR